jgi:hypothetical protein
MGCCFYKDRRHEMQDSEGKVSSHPEHKATGHPNDNELHIDT